MMQTQSSASSPASSDDLSSDDNYLLASSDSDESDVFLPAASSSSSNSSSSSSIIIGGGASGAGGGSAAAGDRGGGRASWRAYGVSVKEEEVNEGASDRSYGSQGSGSASAHHRGQQSSGGCSTSAHHRGQQSSGGCSTSAHHRGQQSSGGCSTSAHHRGQQSSGGCSTSAHHRGQQSSGGCSTSAHHRGQQSKQSSGGCSTSGHHRGQQSSGGCSTSGHHRGQQRKDTATHNTKTHGDLLFSQKCAELQGFIRPLLDLLKGIKRGRFDRGLSSLQQTVAMDRIQRIIGVLQRPNSGEKYLTTILKVETMLKHWFPQVPTNSVPSVSLASSPPDLSQLGGSAPTGPATPPLKQRDQRHIPVKKRRLSWTETDAPSPSTSPVPAKQPRRCGKEEGDEEAEEKEEEEEVLVVVEETQEKRGGETLSSETDGQTDRTERSIKEERSEERTAVQV